MTRWIPCLLLVTLPITLTACDNPPRGDRDGRIGTTSTTEAEWRDARVLPASLTEFSDQVAQRLAMDLAVIPDLAAINEQGGRATVLVGDILNKTGNVATEEFELVRSRLRNNLLTSGYVKDRLRFVENRARLESIRARENVAPSETATNAYDPETTFALNGDFYRISRGSTNQYYMEFQLVSLSTGEILFSDRYDAKQSTDKRPQ